MNYLKIHLCRYREQKNPAGRFAGYCYKVLQRRLGKFSHIHTHSHTHTLTHIHIHTQHSRTYTIKLSFSISLSLSLSLSFSLFTLYTSLVCGKRKVQPCRMEVDATQGRPYIHSKPMSIPIHMYGGDYHVTGYCLYNAYLS